MNTIAGISFFFSCNHAISLLDEAHFADYLQKLSQGHIVNHSEKRAATHTQFRETTPNKTVQESLAHIKKISEKIRQNAMITDVVNIGIGGSDLGPKLICEAFSDKIKKPHVHFVSNLDAAQINFLFKKLSPQTTIFILTSKSFRTLEMLENKRIAEKWFNDHDIDISDRFIAVTHNLAAAREHHIADENILFMPDSIGGRFSVWSAVGLPCAIALGFEQFYEMHQGAFEIDHHFLNAPLTENMPVIYASMLHDALMRNHLKTAAILPYAHRLKTLPDYLQQLFMESLGKHVNTQGELLSHATGPIVFGSAGTSSQHSFQQLMMQGTHPIFADFILPLHQDHCDEKTQAKMISNCLTQVKTLRKGAPHSERLKTITGGKCANLFVMEKLDLKTLGALIAFYEHAVVTLAFMLNINPFDQWGVEYAKCESERLSMRLHNTIPSLSEIEQLINRD